MVIILRIFSLIGFVLFPLLFVRKGKTWIIGSVVVTLLFSAFLALAEFSIYYKYNAPVFIVAVLFIPAVFYNLFVNFISELLQKKVNLEKIPPILPIIFKVLFGLFIIVSLAFGTVVIHKHFSVNPSTVFNNIFLGIYF